MDKILKKLDYYNLWNKAYLIILGLYVLINVLDTTMFEINWPEKMGYVLYADRRRVCDRKNDMLCISEEIQGMGTYIFVYNNRDIYYSGVFTTSYSYLFWG